MNGANGHSSGSGPYRHVRDVTRAVPKADLSRSIDLVLADIETDLKRARFLADIGRLDDALEVFLRAYSHAIKDVPNHRDYVFISNNPPKRDRYARLRTELLEASGSFLKIKEVIQADNLKTGVLPLGAVSSPTSVDGNADNRPTTPQSKSAKSKPSTPTTVLSPGKAKPAVQPKPANLHGNAIKPQTPNKGSTTGQADDLKQRLANLRNPPPMPKVQDPRIRTRPPPASFSEKLSSPVADAASRGQEAGRPWAPTDGNEAPPKLTTKLDGVIDQLPKLPDAIYSPARGNMSNEAANLPSSTPRGMFSRSSSTANFFNAKANSPNLSKSPTGDETPFQNGKRAASVPPRTNRKPLPEGDTITVEELLRYQRAGHFRILLIDVRSRDDFEDGHILSSATICIEPEILDRPRIEATDVEDSMEVGSAEEKRHFERRHDFDMVVIYDQSSENLALHRSAPAAKLFSILSDFDYPEGDPGSKHPKLLRGGLDTWRENLGGSALQNSSHKRKSTYDKPWLKSPTKPIQNAEEARKWEQHLTRPKDEEMDSGDEKDFTPVRNINDLLDFNTRFPPVQESMTSPATTSLESWQPSIQPLSPKSPPPQRPAEYPTLPSEPTRPPPAVPRRSFTGLQPPDDDQGTASKVVSRSDASARRRAMGLQNPGNWCYANSTLQALFASGGFGEELFTQAWQNVYKPPKKDDEKILPPQLLTKIMSNLFLWMGTGKFGSMKADTLMNYLRHITSKGFKGPQPLDQILGGSRQMDAHELLLRLFLEMHDETNRHRDRPDVGLPPPPRDKSILEGAYDIWKLYSQANDSIIDKYWQTLECLITRCDTCQHVTYRVDPPKNHLVLSLPETNQPQSIEGLLNNYFAPEALEDYKCDGCGLKGTCKRTPRFARLPDLLCVFFGRFENKLRKNTVYIDFPHRDLDLTPWTIQGGQQQQYSSLLTGPVKPPQPPMSSSSTTNGITNNHNNNSATQQPLTSPSAPTIDDHHFTKPFRYDAYAVIQHGGQLVGGHYVAVIRDGPEGPDGKSQWRIADDSRLSTHEVGPSRSDPGTKFLFRQNRHWATAMDAYMVFYQRKDVGLV